MRRIEQVLRRPELRERPPVLVDIGAAGRLPKAWRRLARHSICIAFDADDRDFGEQVKRSHSYRTLHLHNHIVTDQNLSELDFYLTHSPHCSSALPPDSEKLAAWIFADLFDMVRKVRLRARRLADVLAEHELTYVDWFKTDSQGTDLRLFLSLGETIVDRVLAASFEPGLIDAYQGEDKLHALLARMDRLPFWIHDMEVRGTQRLSRKLWEQRIRQRTGDGPLLGLRSSPGWAEVSYLNTLEPAGRFDRRDFMLAWVLASIHAQHGFALEVAVKGEEQLGDPIFAELAHDSLREIVGPGDRLLPVVAKKAMGVFREMRNRLLRP